MKGELNDRQRKFVLNLLKGMTQTRAYIEAGYKPRNDDIAASNASHLARNHKVKAYLKERREALEAIITSRIITLALDATAVMQQLMKSDSDGIKLSAAKDMLDRAGRKPVEKREYSESFNLV